MATMEARWQGATDPAVITADLVSYRGHLAFDIGANIGQAAQIIAPNFDRVISFEPCRESFDILDDEAPENVTCLPFAVSDHDGTVTLDEAERSIRSGQLVTGTGLGWGRLVGRRVISCHTLDSLADEYGTPDFVKVDTEGHELQVMLGAEKVLASRPRWLIEVHHREAGEQIESMLLDLDYELARADHGYREGSVEKTNHWWILA